MQDGAFAMRPWPFQHEEAASVTTLLDRVNRERGHFREITGASLQEELATDGALTLSDSDDDASTDTDDKAADGGRYGKPSSREDLFRAKFEMLEKISYAHNEVMMALDFVSLLESKDAPVARQSMSQYLRDNVPAGTLGSDLWKREAVDPTQEVHSLRLAQNVRLEAFEKSADSILAAAKTLESSVKAEVQYWNQINAITAEGWSICRLPGQKHKLGVRFGLSESAPRFSQGSIAALDVDDEGDISITTGTAARAKSFRVTIHRAGVVTGQSTHLDISDLSGASLEARIRHARDSLFNDELFYEMERESRALTSHDVRAYGSSLSIPLGDASDSTLAFHLIDDKATSSILSEGLHGADNSLAQAVHCLTKLLLCKAHRDLLVKRSEIPPPLTERTKDRPTLSILRPVLHFLALDRATRTINTKVRQLSSLLQQAGLKNEPTLATLSSSKLQHVQTIDGLTNHLIGSWSCDAVIQMEGADEAARLTATSSSTNDSSANDSTLVFNVHLGQDPVLRLSRVEQALVAFDRYTARMISLFIATKSGAGWKVDDISADLTRQAGASTNNQREACVVVDSVSDEPKLSLVWTSGRHDWHIGQDEQQPLLDVWEDVSSS